MHAGLGLAIHVFRTWHVFKCVLVCVGVLVCVCVHLRRQFQGTQTTWNVQFVPLVMTEGKTRVVRTTHLGGWGEICSTENTYA